MSTLLAWTRNRLCRNPVNVLPSLKNMRLQSKPKSSDIISESSKVASEEMNGKDDGTCEPKEPKGNGDFSNFRISSKTVKKLQERGITHLFPIQAKTYDYVYDGCDIIARAKTGTGKTLSFALPLCEKLREIKQVKDKGRPPMVLTLAPTRELANQILKEFELIKSKKLSTVCVYGGVSYDSQEAAFRNGLDILVGTPGRIFDHMERGNLDLSKLKHVVLDEADRMLEMGFQEKVDEILKNAYTQGKPQTLLFSATVPTWVSKASKKYMGEDKKLVDLVGEEGDQTACGVEHKALRCPYHERAATIADIVQVYSGAHGRAMIFTSTKKEANELALNSVLKQETQVLHGDINQAQREITLSSFREGKIRVLVATDVASRGLDIPEVDLVIQTEPPADIDSYIHRSGRTGRAGRTGVCIVFYKPNQEYLLQAVEKQAGIKFMRIGAPQPSDIIKASAKDATSKIFRNDRNVNGEGVAIYVKDTLPVPKIKQNSNKLELLSPEIKQENGRAFFLVCWYRPPTSGADDAAFENLREALGELGEEGNKIILVGDTNCDFKNTANANAC
eukprot:gene8058-13973_t